MEHHFANRRVHARWRGRQGMPALLSLEEVEVRRGMGVVLRDHNLTVKGGQCIALTGSNGSGKSTVLEVAAGLLPLEQGKVLHGSTPVIDHEGRRRQSPVTVGLTLQKNGVLGSEVVEDHLLLACSMAGFSVDVAPFLEAFNLKHRRKDLVAHLSQGQVRKISVLSALLPAFASNEACLVLLDEPSTGLDEDAVKVLCRWISVLRQRGHGVVLATHDERLLEQATHVHAVAKGTTEPRGVPLDEADIATPAATARRVTPSAFGIKTHRQTMLWLNTNGMAALLTLGLLLALGEFILDLTPLQRLGFLLAPAFAAGLCGEPLVAAMREERASSWWTAVGGGVPHAGWMPLLIGAAVTAGASVGFQLPFNTLHVLVGAAVCFAVWHAVRLMQLATTRLARPHAAMVGLLTPVLILPYAVLVDWLTR